MRLPVLAPVVALVALAACGGEDEAGPTPTFYRDVEPIVMTRCAGCHRAGGIAPFAFGSYEDARARASTIADLVERRVMPPWPPSERGVPLRHSRALTEDEVGTIVRWAKGGAPEGDPADHREHAPELPAVRSDLAVEMSEPYLPNPARHDDYRCFVVDPGLTETRWLTGYDLMPGTPGVHHVILFLVLEEGFERLDALEAEDPGEGYTCFGASGVEDAGSGLFPPVRVLGGWAPGSGATPLPPGTGIELPPRSRLVMQVHYNTQRSVEPDLTRAVLELAESGAGLLPAVLFPVLNDEFSVPPGATDHVVERRATAGATIFPGTLHGAFPHMHLHGKSISVGIRRGGAETLLVDIPRWDFHWQGGYQFVTPEPIRTGDVVELRCVFDNVAGTVPLTWGEGTEDEMCLAFLYLTP
jgi:hypothetical protein